MVHNYSSAGFIGEVPEVIDGDLLARSPRLIASGIRVEVLDQCASSNALLLDRARAGAPHASALVCEQQTAGRGRRGNVWVSGRGESLTFSLLWRFGSRVAALSALSLAVAVASARALESQGVAQVRLKWPNDLLFDGRKLGGILVETLQDAGNTVAVIGIGLNVGNSAALRDRVGHALADIREAGSLATRSALLAAQLTQLADLLPCFEKEGFAPLRDDWLARHAWHGRQVQLCSGGRLHAQGETVGVAEDGALLLNAAGEVRRFYSGELSLRQA